MKMENNCISCNEELSEIAFYNLNNGKCICDYCYQEIGQLKKVNGKWVESVTIDNVELKLVK